MKPDHRTVGDDSCSHGRYRPIRDAGHGSALPPSFFGGKGNAGTIRTLINILPRHDYYIEAFLGSGRLLRHKRPADVWSHGIETDPRLLRAWATVQHPSLTVHDADAFEVLPVIIAECAMRPGARTLAYFDPPYMMQARRSKGARYHREWSDEDHIAFFEMARRLECLMVVSHLPCPEYSDAFSDWHTFTFTNYTQGGPQVEQVWCNFEPTPDLHEFTYIGDNFRQREQFKRQFEIIRRRFDALPPAARLALLAMLPAPSHLKR